MCGRDWSSDVCSSDLEKFRFTSEVCYHTLLVLIHITSNKSSDWLVAIVNEFAIYAFLLYCCFSNSKFATKYAIFI